MQNIVAFLQRFFHFIDGHVGKILVRIVDKRICGRGKMPQSVIYLADTLAERAAKTPETRAEMRFAHRVYHIAHRLRFGKRELAVYECAAGEFAGTCI